MANLRSRRIRGNLAFYDTHRKRLIDAIGLDVAKWSSDFTSMPVDNTTGDPTEWTVTVVEAGGGGDSTMSLVDGSGGILRLLTDNADNDGVSAQLLAESFELTSDQDLYFGLFGITINDVTNSDLFLGLAITDTAILGGVTDRIGFQSVDADAGLDFAMEKGSTETLTEDVHTMVDATAFDAEFYFDGTNVEVYINGVLVASPVNTNMPDDQQMRVSLEFLTGEAVAQTLDIDRIAVIQIGR